MQFRQCGCDIKKTDNLADKGGDKIRIFLKIEFGIFICIPCCFPSTKIPSFYKICILLKQRSIIISNVIIVPLPPLPKYR